MMRNSVRRWALPAALVAAGAAVLAGTVVAVAASVTPTADPGVAPAVRADAVTSTPADRTDPILARHEAEVARTPGNYVAWAALALRNVQKAKVLADPAYYARAEKAAERSLAINSVENPDGFAALAALRAARHDFRGARSAALQGLAQAPDNPTLHANLADAATQLGRTAEAQTAIDRLNELDPGVPAFTRASYAFELRGDLRAATSALEQALAIAPTQADTAAVRGYLGDLALTQGEPAQALGHYVAGLRSDPQYLALLQGRARAQAALGQVDAALRDYAKVAALLPQPDYLIEYGDYLRSLGRHTQASQQYAVVTAVVTLFEAKGVALDTDATLFYADQGRPDLALSYGRAGLKARPFVEMFDAYAWALHANGDDVAAQRWSQKAQATGMRNALFAFHAGMIELSLGNRSAARTQLARALTINPYFNPVHAREARRALERL